MRIWDNGEMERWGEKRGGDRDRKVGGEKEGDWREGIDRREKILRLLRNLTMRFSMNCGNGNGNGNERRREDESCREVKEMS